MVPGLMFNDSFCERSFQTKVAKVRVSPPVMAGQQQRSSGGPTAGKSSGKNTWTAQVGDASSGNERDRRGVVGEKCDGGLSDWPGTPHVPQIRTEMMLGGAPAMKATDAGIKRQP
nr:hypothetical protein CFP56_31772 [Quercus suber]